MGSMKLQALNGGYNMTSTARELFKSGTSQAEWQEQEQQ